MASQFFFTNKKLEQNGKKKKLFNFHRQFSKPNIMNGNSSVVYTVTMFNRALKIDNNSEILSQNKKKNKNYYLHSEQNRLMLMVAM